ncbi:MAG: indolepyruvate ferredoxin oxidoreductase family protein, partial [Kordiimonadaceae bacterium]|nr:indolepyruvate ferredoxin oxidoreductase family protein [Kordiimonadaceae bacterium]
FMSGLQALTRIPMVQMRRDRAAGLNTAGFISGYRGSPLGGYDMELMRAKKYLEEYNITFEFGVNEDLAATSVWGTQQVNLLGGSNYDGVFGIWYGKSPGVDRSGDVMRHANAYGTAPKGGVLAIVGDDHACKSSTLPCQSDHALSAYMIPILYPASIQEFVEYGVLGIEMSRYSGCWTALKVTSENVETSGTVDLSRENRLILTPDEAEFQMPKGGVNIRLGDVPRDVDWRLQNYKLFACHAFCRKNKIDRVVMDSPKPRFGIVTSGKSYGDVRLALVELGITDEIAKDIGLRLYKVGMPWPLEPEGIREFCEGLDEVLVVEEKREMIEHQLRWQLYNWKQNVRPTVVGKHDEDNKWLLPPENELDVGMIAHAIAARMSKLYKNKDIQKRLDYFSERQKAANAYTPEISRTPYFCSGCPHNSSTKVPEGSKATAGIGCHIMAMNMDRNTETFTHMGGEGVPWVGQASFTKQKHTFVNLGDGTYMHSGSLAIRQSVIAKVNVTYKILYNDAVAMTGGQAVEGNLTVPQICAQLKAEGVGRVAIASEFPETYKSIKLPDGVEVHHRDMMMPLQEEMREIEGATAIIYDQTCAAEKRRKRKRGLMEDPDHRVFINDEVCEGCGDCSVQSNCVSVEPLETALGRKRTINQSSCNKDISCVKGFCPAFVSVRGAQPRKSKAGMGDLAGFDLPELPMPTVPDFNSEFGDCNILVTGIGGTGVLTIGGLLGMAAHLDGKASSVMDMMGLAQKGGAVMSHVRLADTSDKLRSPRIVTGRTDVLLACDSIVAAGKDAGDLLRADRTASVINSHLSPIADFVRNKDIDFKQVAVQKQLDDMTNEDSRFRVPAQEIAAALMGDSIATNVFVLGYAWQKGLIPISLKAIEESIHLNKVAIETNLRTLYWGRMAAHDMGAIKRVLKGSFVDRAPIPVSLDGILEHRSKHLTAYQNTGLADKYTSFVSMVASAEKAACGGDKFAITVAKNYSKLLSYKDEYEIARLYSSDTFKKKLTAQFDGKMKVSLHMAPPILPGIDPATGRPRKREFGAWILSVFPVMASFKGLRGTAFDIFGYSKERQMERGLITEYEELITDLLKDLRTDNIDLADELARLPETVRGFGPVKIANVKATAKTKKVLLARWDEQKTPAVAAE